MHDELKKLLMTMHGAGVSSNGEATGATQMTTPVKYVTNFLDEYSPERPSEKPSLVELKSFDKKLHYHR